MNKGPVRGRCRQVEGTDTDLRVEGGQSAHATRYPRFRSEECHEMLFEQGQVLVMMGCEGSNAHKGWASTDLDRW